MALDEFHEWYTNGYLLVDRGDIDLLNDDIKIVYLKKTYGFNPISQVYWSDIKIDECVAAGYTAGGYTIPNIAKNNDASDYIVKTIGDDATHPRIDFDAENEVAYIALKKDTGNDATSPMISCIKLPKAMSVMYGAIWALEGIYNGLVELFTSTLPQTISAINITVSEITASSFKVTIANATSLTNTDYIQLTQDNYSDAANYLETAEGQKMFTPAEMEAGVTISKSNQSSTTKTLYASGVSDTYGRGNWTSKSFSIPANQAPTVPTNLAESNKATTSVTVSFTGSSDPDAGDYVERYRLYRNTTNDPATATLHLANTGGTAETPPSTSFNVTGETAGSTVYYWVTAVDNNGNESAKSSVLSVVFPTNMPPSVSAANILVSNASATTPGTIDAFTVKIGSISNADTIKTVRVAFFTSAELADKDTNWGTIPSGRKIELVAGVDDAAITAIQGGSGQAFTGKALTKDITYTPSVKIEETTNEGPDQWGSWVEASTTVLYASPTCTVQAPTSVLGETGTNNDGSLTANGTTAAGLQRNVTRWRISVGPSSVSDGDPTNGACQVSTTFTGKNVASNTAFTEALSDLDLSPGNYKIWIQVGDELTGLGAWTTTPASFTVSLPSASNVVANSLGVVVALGNTLTGDYDYNAGSYGSEGTSTFRWLRNDVAISGATALTYTLVEADVDAIIKFEVTPTATRGSTAGSAVQSAGVGPVVSNVAPTSTISMVGALSSTSQVTVQGTVSGIGTGDSIASIEVALCADAGEIADPTTVPTARKFTITQSADITAFEGAGYTATGKTFAQGTEYTPAARVTENMNGGGQQTGAWSTGDGKICGCIFRLELEEASGNTCADTAGSNNGTVVDTVAIIAGLQGSQYARRFSEAGYISIGDKIIPAAAHTIKFTFKHSPDPGTGKYPYLFDTTNGTAYNKGPQVYLNPDGKLSFNGRNGNGSSANNRFTITTDISICDGVEHVIECIDPGTTDSNAVKIKVDGVARAQGTATSATPPTPTANLCIGALSNFSASYRGLGDVDNIEVYNYAR